MVVYNTNMHEIHPGAPEVNPALQRMELREKTRLLALVDVLEPLTVDELESFARRTPTFHLTLGKLLHTPSHTSELFFLLLEGRLRLYKVAAGREFTLEVVDAGALAGQGALTVRQYKGVYARAMEPSTVAIVNREHLERLVRDRPEVGLKLIEVLGERLSVYGERLADMGCKEVRPRLASLILQLLQSEGVVGREGYSIPTPYTHADLAAMIGAGRVAVTKALGELKSGGCVEVRDRALYITDAEALTRASLNA